MRGKDTLLFILLTFFLICCSPSRNDNPDNNNSKNSGETVQTIRNNKRTIPGLTPEPYYIGFDEPTFITVVTNSTQPQKVWMIYYDTDEKEWVEKTLGEGIGENNRIIGEVTFLKRHGIISKREDFPEFYMGYSVDEGRTWINHKIGKESLHCIEGKGREIKQKDAHLLVSLPLNPKNNLPDVAIILQWNKFRRWSGNADLVDADFKNLCGALRELPLDWSGAAQ